MELREFIKNALLDITQGVAEANTVSDRFKIASQYHHGKGLSGESVEFDVLVEATESREKGAKGGLGVSIVSIGGELKATQNNQNSHRLKFKVFVTEE